MLKLRRSRTARSCLTRSDMINIATHHGIIYDVDFTYELMQAIMSDNFIKDYNFIEF